MALTQISTAGVKDDAVTSGKIPANAVGSSELADNAVTSAKIASGGVQASNMSSNSVTTGAIATGAVTTAKIADESVTLAKLEHGTSSNNGKFLRANNGADPTFETVTSTTINNNADTRIITGSGTANTLNAKSGVTINGANVLGILESGQQQLNIGSTNAGGAALILDGDSNGDGAGGDYALIKHNTDGDLEFFARNPSGATNYIFKSGNGETLRLDSSGRLKINHTDHPGQLDNTFISIHDTNGGGGISKNYAMIQVNNYGTGNTGDLSGIGFGAGAGNAYIKGSIGFMRTGGWGQGDFTFNLNTDSSSALVNDTDELVRIRKEGGITFNGDTAAANALEDYEEGSYTATFYGSSTGTGSPFGMNPNKLRYTKVGRVVHVTGRVYINSSSNNPTGSTRMLLPFTSASNNLGNDGQAYSYVTRYNVYSPNNDWNLIFEVEPNSTFGNLLWCKPGATWANASADSHINQNAAYYGFDFSYTTP